MSIKEKIKLSSKPEKKKPNPLGDYIELVSKGNSVAPNSRDVSKSRYEKLVELSGVSHDADGNIVKPLNPTSAGVVRDQSSFNYDTLIGATKAASERNRTENIASDDIKIAQGVGQLAIKITEVPTSEQIEVRRL